MPCTSRAIIQFKRDAAYSALARKAQWVVNIVYTTNGLQIYIYIYIFVMCSDLARRLQTDNASLDEREMERKERKCFI